MIAFRTITLICDEKGCTRKYHGRIGDPPSVTRREAATAGWVAVRVRSGLHIEHYTEDFCPEHAPRRGRR